MPPKRLPKPLHATKPGTSRTVTTPLTQRSGLENPRPPSSDASHDRHITGAGVSSDADKMASASLRRDEDAASSTSVARGARDRGRINGAEEVAGTQAVKEEDKDDKVNTSNNRPREEESSRPRTTQSPHLRHGSHSWPWWSRSGYSGAMAVGGVIILSLLLVVTSVGLPSCLYGPQNLQASCSRLAEIGATLDGRYIHSLTSDFFVAFDKSCLRSVTAVRKLRCHLGEESLMELKQATERQDCGRVHLMVAAALNHSLLATADLQRCIDAWLALGDEIKSRGMLNEEEQSKLTDDRYRAGRRNALDPVMKAAMLQAGADLSKQAGILDILWRNVEADKQCERAHTMHRRASESLTYLLNRTRSWGEPRGEEDASYVQTCTAEEVKAFEARFLDVIDKLLDADDNVMNRYQSMDPALYNLYKGLMEARDYTWGFVSGLAPRT